MNWGTKIVIAYVLFGGLIISLVCISMKQEIGLVDPHYYEQEIAYQSQINRIQNFDGLTLEPIIHYIPDQSAITVAFPTEWSSLVTEGHILFYRPSKAGMDKAFPMELDINGQKVFDTQHLKKGLWRLKLNWSLEGQEYYHEKIIIL